jgi:hypothetical protein
MEHQTEDVATVVDPRQEEQPELESPEGEIEEVVLDGEDEDATEREEEFEPEGE